MEWAIQRFFEKETLPQHLRQEAIMVTEGPFAFSSNVPVALDPYRWAALPRSCKNAFAEQTRPFIAGGIGLIR